MAVVVARPALITNVFERGNLTVKCITVEKSNATSSPPKSLLIVTPTEEGTYPVLLFLHGFCIKNTSYSQLLQHISSHGFIVVAPQLYEMFEVFTKGTEEVNYAAAVTNWLSTATGLQSMLPENVQSDLRKLALAGHSRGGKAAFALALGHAQTSLKFSVLLGLDPVAGLSAGCQTSPKILTYIPRSFNLAIPIAVIGTGLGDEKRCCTFPACAPNGVNHCEFFAESKPPCCYFYAKDYGHMDMLNDTKANLSSCMCVSGKGAKDPFRKCLGGIFVAFLRAYLEGESSDLKAIVDDPAIAPVTLDPIIYIN